MCYGNNNKPPRIHPREDYFNVRLKKPGAFRFVGPQNVAVVTAPGCVIQVNHGKNRGFSSLPVLSGWSSYGRGIVGKPCSGCLSGHLRMTRRRTPSFYTLRSGNHSMPGSLIRQRNHQPLTHRFRIAHERFDRGVGALAGFELRQGGAVHAAKRFLLDVARLFTSSSPAW
jgi:hypothetical protein